MKNKLLSKMAVIAAFLLAFFIAPLVTKAQTCPYTITNNNATCDVICTWTVSQPTSCTALCSSGNSGTILAGGGMYQIPCISFCGTSACLVGVTLTTVDGVMLTTLIRSFSTGAPASGPGAGTCSGMTMTLTCTAGGTTVQ